MTAEIFGLLGLIVGLWVAAYVARWVGAHWDGARPAALFWVLGWLVAAMAGLAIAALLAWWGALASEALQSTPAGLLERPGGAVVGATMGAIVISLLLVCALLLPWARPLSGAAAEARVTRPLLSGGERALAWMTRYFQGSDWLRHRYLEAERRTTPRRPS